MSLPESFEPHLRIPNAKPLSPEQHDENFGDIATVFSNMTSGVANANLTDITRMFTMLMTPGSMIFVHVGRIADIKEGFKLCDGTVYSTVLGTGTVPDLRDKFIIGAQQDQAGVASSNITGNWEQIYNIKSHSHSRSGGVDPITLQASNIPKLEIETGEFDRMLKADGTCTVGSIDSNDPSGSEPNLCASQAVDLEVGSGSPEEIEITDDISYGSALHVPPFYALAYVTYVGKAL